MPFQSKKQEAFLYSQHPGIANKWQNEFGQPKNLPAYKMGAPKNLQPKSPWLKIPGGEPHLQTLGTIKEGVNS